MNVSFTILELIGGLWTNSLTILSDALHDFGDSIALIVAWVLEKKSGKAHDKKHTFGYHRLSLFSALFAGVILISGSILILATAIPRLFNPEHVNSAGMIGLAIIGIIFNGAGFFRLKTGKSMNEKVLSWHLLEDVLGWAIVLIGAIIIQFWDLHIIDPLMTIGYTLFILVGVTKNLKETYHIFLQGVPKDIDLNALRKSILSIKGVRGIHDLHVWSLEGENNILTGHVIVTTILLKKPNHTRNLIKRKLIKYNIEHSTIELESKSFCSGKNCSCD